MKVKVLVFATPWTIAHQDPLSIGFSRQEYWSGLPFPFPGDLPDPGIKLESPTFWPNVLTKIFALTGRCPYLCFIDRVMKGED